MHLLIHFNTSIHNITIKEWTYGKRMVSEIIIIPEFTNKKILLFKF